MYEKLIFPSATDSVLALLKELDSLKYNFKNSLMPGIFKERLYTSFSDSIFFASEGSK